MVATVLLLVRAGSAESVSVGTTAELKSAISAAVPGTIISLKPGSYQGGMQFEAVQGEPAKPIVLRAAEPSDAPVIVGGSDGMHFSKAKHLVFDQLIFDGATHNGLHLDDAGSVDTPAEHITLRSLTFRNIGRGGNHDALKLAGVRHFVISSSVFEDWGAVDGAAVDLVGCRHGKIEFNKFAPGDRKGTAVSVKGGSSEISIRKNRFIQVGERGVNIGGITGTEFFRPALTDPPFYEASRIIVEKNTFVGGDAAVAFIGIDGAIVRDNLIYRPNKWALRILQENVTPGFGPARNGVFSSNVILFDSNNWFEGGVNIGPGTDAGSFTFSGNQWFCMNEPSKSEPVLPSPELGGIYGVEPNLSAIAERLKR